MSTRHTWTWAQREVLRELYPDVPTQALARHWGLTCAQVYQQAARMGLKKSEAFLSSKQSGRMRPGDERGKSGRFPKGHVPANKGLRRPGYAPGRMAQTQFKKGAMHGAAQHNYRPIGSLRIVYGNLERKVTDDPNIYPAKRWRPVHRLVWEAANGPVPRGWICVFKPGKHTIVEQEISLDKIECITHAENMRRNTLHRYPKPVVEVIRLRGRLNRQINKRTRK